MQSGQLTLFGKTSREFSVRTTMLSAASWRDLSAQMKPSIRAKDGRTRVWLMGRSAEQRGASWMPNISAWPNGASVCSLWQVLETGRMLRKYFLSGRACGGILRRAAKRGKELSEHLAHTLRQGADWEPISSAREE